MTVDPIYLDYAATTPLDEDVLAEMLPFLTQNYGNPSSVYALGRHARYTLETCRKRVAVVLDVEPSEIVFTSGGTEANNTVILGAHGGIVTSKAEHDAVLQPVLRIPDSVTLDVTESGAIDTSQLERLVSGPKSFALGSFMAVNNELGTINPIGEISEILRAHGVFFHSDAVQAAVCQDLSKLASMVDYMSLSGHKIGGPKGAGVLFVRAGAPLNPLIHGGGQEQDRRSGTENLAGIVGFTRALEKAASHRSMAIGVLSELRNQLITYFAERLGSNTRILSPINESDSSPHILSVLFSSSNDAGLDGEMLLLGLDVEGVYASAGSACSSGTIGKSHVIEALDIPPSLARGVVRFSLSTNVSPSVLLEALKRVERVVRRMID